MSHFERSLCIADVITPIGKKIFEIRREFLSHIDFGRIVGLERQFSSPRQSRCHLISKGLHFRAIGNCDLRVVPNGPRDPARFV